ncbi:hypothetical protein L484_002592 [Morus notabilis]|uniref:Uncharacterized protein n=1 Tax=Morus notabilis TaxID=981085 RepID=W9SA10_9ROSA|nr:hypothetical protein L484_002592 [Morus notabilis]
MGSTAGDLGCVGGLLASCRGGLDFVLEFFESGGELGGGVELLDSGGKPIKGDGWLLGAAK